MSDGYEQVPESFVKELEAKRRRLVEAQEENGVNLDALVDFLYPDTAHLVFELLQNAEDAGAMSARFELSETRLSFVHDGRPFSKQDLDDITNYFKSAKYEKEDAIGRFGIGFKSVFTCTENPRIYSATVAFEIVDRVIPRAIPRPASAIGLSDGETVIELPFNGTMKTAAEAVKEIRQGLEDMPAMSILHLQRIESIEWRTDQGNQGSIRRVELEGGVVRIDIKKPTGPESRFFLRFREPYAEGSTMHLDVVFELEEKEQLTVEQLTEVAAERFRVIPAKPGRVAVFFPAAKETSNLRFHLHAPFIPELSRASIKEHADNAALIGRLAALTATSLETIRELGLLDRQFLGVLPNSRDSLPETYRPFHSAIVRAMHEEHLVPTYGGGHERATRLLQGPADLKAFLGVDDIRFLMSGWDYDTPSLPAWSPRTDRSVVPSSTYRGWAVSATLRNTEVDRFLSDLDLTPFQVEHLVPPDSKNAREIEGWLAPHDAAWHTSYYASLDKYWGKTRRKRFPSESLRGFDRLRKLAIVRTRSAKYRRAAECRFLNDGEFAPEGITIVDPETYSSGTGAMRAKAGLKRMGVREINDQDRVVGILEAYYGEAHQRPSWDIHRDHVDSFIELVRSGRVTEKVFGDYRLLLSIANEWVRPGELYAGSEYTDATVAAYYRLLHDLNESATRCQIDSRYRDLPRFDDFAKDIGVAYTIPICKAKCESNPHWAYLQSGGGWSRTAHEINSDWYIPHLERVLEQAKERDPARHDLARGIWTAVGKAKEESFEAVFRRNAHASIRRGRSQLVITLRKHAWVPQREGQNDLVVVTPRSARSNRLPEGFAFDSGWAWIKATEFGEARRQQERQITKEKLDQEAKVRERAAMAKGFGFASLEEAEFFAGLPEEVKKEFRERVESARRPIPEFPKLRNPGRRSKMAKKQAAEAPNRRTEYRSRIVTVGEATLKEDARTKLQANYEEHAQVSLCQVFGCEDRSFKLKGGAWYFEAVRFLGLDKMAAADYVALCPRHAAMFQHANESKDRLKGEFEERCASANGDVMTVPVVLAEESVDILLAPTHVIDLEAALKVDEVDGE